MSYCTHPCSTAAGLAPGSGYRAEQRSTDQISSIYYYCSMRAASLHTTRSSMILGTMPPTASKAAVKLGSCVRIWVEPHGQGLSCGTPTRGPSQKANTSSGAGKVVYTNGCCKSTVAAITTRVWRENGDDH